MDYEKKYNEALNWMRELYPGLHGATKEDAEHYFPQLRESEDEKTRRRLIDFISNIKGISESGRSTLAVRKDDAEMCNAFLLYLEKQKELPFVKDVMLGYPGLYFYDGERMHFRGPAMEEKQKENPKNAISIPADCALNARCPYKIHGDEDFIGDIKDTPAYHFGFDEGVRSEREKQKEQKPAGKQDYSGLNDLERAIHRGFLVAGVENVPVTIIKETAQECLAQMKPAEWSEEDELMRTAVIQTLERFGGRGTTEMQIAWLKSLRPQPREEIKESEKPVPKDLEEAAEEKYPVYWKDYPKDGIARSELSYDANEQRRNAFIDGAKWDREQMLKEAVEAIISQCPGSNEIILHNPSTVHSWEFPWTFSAKGLNKGDKVRIIVCKKEDLK